MEILGFTPPVSYEKFHVHDVLTLLQSSLIPFGRLFRWPRVDKPQR